MVVQTRLHMTVQEFDTWVQQLDGNYEYIAGEAVEVVSNSVASNIASRISGFIFMYLTKNDIGHLTGADGGYMIQGERYIPDVGFIRYEKQSKLIAHAYNPNPPDLAVEVISDTSNNDELQKLRVKTTNYLASNVLVWVVDYHSRRVEIHQAGQSVTILDETDTITAGDVLPGFELAVKEIFPKE